MCGIFCVISPKDSYTDLKNYIHYFKDNIVRRGPDCFKIVNHSTENLYDLLFAASILCMQGKYLVSQPVSNHKSIFVYNGDIFGGVPKEILHETGDTLMLFDLLENAENVSVALSKVQGPNAFIYFNKFEQKLYFGRDIFGRSSLLIGRNGKTICLTSTAKRAQDFDFMELPSIGTFYWNLKSDDLYVLPFQYRNQNFSSKLSELEKFLGKSITINQELIVELDERFTDPLPKQLEIYERIKRVEADKALEILLSDSSWLGRVNKLNKLLESAIEKRVSTPKFCKNCSKDRLSCNHTTVGVLFSGGVDCAIVALIADKFTEKNNPIDLMNVSFDEINMYESPDRQTGRQTLEELKRICPNREWRFLEINVSQKELDEQRELFIADLIYPLNTVLDDSLGCALWFASRGMQNSYTSSCRVLLVGMGADELFGGYTKHRAAFKQNSWLGLQNSLENDWQNLSHRNLARDDRVICDHGRQLRTPYLDEDVIKFVRGLNCWEKTYPSEEVPQGLGEKILLRTLAYSLGLKQASLLKKRAIQFGSRIANKKENANEISIRLRS